MSDFDRDRYAYFVQQRLAPMRVQIEVPDGRWQKVKARLKRQPGLGWLKVRTRWETRFVGHVQTFPTNWA